MKRLAPLVAALLSIFFIGCNESENSNSHSGDVPATPVISFSVTASFPHDTSYFTEGLEFYNGQLMESAGLNGQSRLSLSDVKTGNKTRELKLDDKYFGEGITVFRDTVYQLTYKENVVLVYTAKDFMKVKELPLRGEGWGLTNDGQQLIASNGSSDLYFYEPSTFKLIKTQTVTENGSFVININELEFVNGFVYANQWQSNQIFKIDPKTGFVVAKMDLTDIVNREKAANPKALELNGIAYNQEAKKFYITGKNWSQLYEVQFNH